MVQGGAGYSRVTKIKPRTRTEQVALMYLVPPTTEVHLEEDIPIRGTITSIVLHQPDGCNALVDVSAGHNGKQLAPSTGVIALNDATPVVPVSEKVEKGELFWAVINNGDGVNPHSISIIATIEV